MGCGLSTRLNPEDAATFSHGHISDINSSATGKNLDHGGDDSVLSSAQRSQKSVSSSRVKDAKPVCEGGEKEEEEKDGESYHSEVIIFPRSPSFREYCIASSNSRNRCFSDNFNDKDSASSIKNNGYEDSTNKSEDKNEGKKIERRIVGLRNVMPRRKKNLINFGCYTGHAAAYEEKTIR